MVHDSYDLFIFWIYQSNEYRGDGLKDVFDFVSDGPPPPFYFLDISIEWL